jgi:RNA-binding protein
MPPPELTGRQRKALRALAHKLQPVVQVGQDGASEGVIGAIDAALLAHELIKVRLHEPMDKKASAHLLANAAGAALCGLVGHTVILYRPHPEKPRIVLKAEA